MLTIMDKIRPSFIDESKLVILSTGEFIATIKSIKKFGLPHILKNLDLSEVDFLYAADKVEMIFEGWKIANVIFSRFNPKYREKKHLHGISFKGAEMNGVGFAQAFLDRCNFDSFEEKSAILENIDFFFSEFSYCRFRGCNMNMVDFRYAKVSDCSMNKTIVTYGDFYYCDFMGCTAFVGSEFSECSFTNTVFEHQVIRFESIKHILQDDVNNYMKIILNSNWQRYNPCGKRGYDLEKKESCLIEKDIREEAIEMYKQLSGIYAGKGLNKDSNAAYKEMKKKELRKSWQNIRESVCGLLLLLVLMGLLIYKLVGHINCTVVLSCLGVYLLYLLYDCIKDRIKKVLRHIGKEIEDIYEMLSGLLTFLMGYGYKWVNVIIVFVLLIFIGAAGYKNYDNCSWKDALNDSFNNIIGIAQKDCWGMFAGIHHLLGVLLIGYLGFIFANKMRNNL